MWSGAGLKVFSDNISVVLRGTFKESVINAERVFKILNPRGTPCKRIYNTGVSSKLRIVYKRVLTPYVYNNNNYCSTNVKFGSIIRISKCEMRATADYLRLVALTVYFYCFMLFFRSCSEKIPVVTSLAGSVIARVGVCT